MPRRSRFNISNTNETINLRERRLAEGKLFSGEWMTDPRHNTEI